MPPLVPLVGTTLDSWLPSFWRLVSLEQPPTWLRPHKGEQIPHLRRRLDRGRLLLYFAIRSEARADSASWPVISEAKASLPEHLHCLTRVVQGERRAELARALLSRSPHSQKHLLCFCKDTKKSWNLQIISTKLLKNFSCARLICYVSSSYKNDIENIVYKGVSWHF